MKVLVLGAAGQTGRLIVEEALAHGHEVTALIHETPLNLQHERLRCVSGDAADAKSLAQTVKGHDAVVHAVGSGNMKASTLRTQSATAVVEAMSRTRVSRLIAMSGLGAGDSLQALPALVRWLLVPLVLGRLLEDQNGLEQAIRASTLDWTLVRPGELKDKPKAEQLKVALDGRGVGNSVSRASVAAFIVEQLDQSEFSRAAPALGG